MKNIFLNQLFYVIVLVNFIACTRKTGTISQKAEIQAAALLNNEVISLQQVDSLISSQLLELRMSALEMLLSRTLIENEANRLKISVEALIEKEIFKKAKKITSENILNYIKESKTDRVDTSAIISYLTNLHRKERQVHYVDSLKNNCSVKFLLQPDWFNKADTAGLYAHALTENKSNTVVYIVSDFKCHSCQKAEKQLSYLYEKYTKDVEFKFVYFSGYIDEDALACEAAAKQGKFRMMHDIIFQYADSLYKKSIYTRLAKKIGLDSARFESDMRDKSNLKKLLHNKEVLTSAKIYSTPQFIVNNKVLEGKYAIDYLEAVICKELKANKN